MYNYVIQIALDRTSQTYVQNLRNCIRQNNIVDRQRGWLPHITVDKYNCKNEKNLINKITEIVSDIKVFKFNVSGFSSFSGETLYLKPDKLDEIIELKNKFDKGLSRYRLSKELRRKEYNPHITICTNDRLEDSIQVLMNYFSSFEVFVSKIWLYTEDMRLVKEWELNL